MRGCSISSRAEPCSSPVLSHRDPDPGEQTPRSAPPHWRARAPSAMTRGTHVSSTNYGEPCKFDPNFRGPVQNRSCTDAFWCAVFASLIFGYIALGAIAWIHGDPRKLVYPTDSQGQFCGQGNSSNANKAILFYFNVLKCASPSVLIDLQCPTTQLCVSKCPDRFLTLLDATNSKSWKYYRQFCKPGFELGRKSVADVIRDEDCPSMIVPSRAFLQRCFPDLSRRNGVWTVDNQTVFKDGDNNRRSIDDLKEAARAIGCIPSSLCCPLVTFFLLAVCVSYAAVTAVFLASSGNAVYKVVPADERCVYANITCSPKNFSQTNVSSVCPGSRCLFAFYGGESVYHRYILPLHLLNLFMLLWLLNFILALNQCTLAGAFASYYWALVKPRDVPGCPLYSSFSRAIRYHTGSLAFGSLILAVTQTLRVGLEYLDYRLKGSQNGCARFLICCLRSCFWCLEHFIRFLNRNAYIMGSNRP